MAFAEQYDESHRANGAHVLMVSFPGQGHINPLLRLAKRLAQSGLNTTLYVPELAGQSIRKANNIIDDKKIPVGQGSIRFEFFDDGWSSGFPRTEALELYMAQLELTGRENLTKMIKRLEEEGNPISCLINNPFIPWVSDVAESLGVPNALFWVQSCASFSAYYHFHHNLVPFPSENEPEIDVQLPSIPLLKYDEIPSFLHPKSPYTILRRAILGQFSNLSKIFCVVMDSFQQLEPEILETTSKIIGRPIKTIGPLFKDQSTSISTDFLKADNCIEFLDSKPEASVVYISFGSVVHLKQEQVEEIAHGLLSSEVSFLWVLRPPPAEHNTAPHVLPEGFLEKTGDRGRVVQWSPQVEVLSHPSTACFLTHCGWNSTIEALTSGVPVLAFPQWGDQVLDAKFLVDVYKTGIRICRGVSEGTVRREEVESCLRAAIGGPTAAEMKENAGKWKKAAAEALMENGTSNRDLRDFLNEIERIGLGSRRDQKYSS